MYDKLHGEYAQVLHKVVCKYSILVELLFNLENLFTILKSLLNMI